MVEEGDTPWGDCDCEEDIEHFLHNLGHFHKVLLQKAPNLNLSNGEVISLFKVWLRGIVEDKEPQPMNPLHELFKQMFNPDGDPNINMSSGHPFSFRLYDDEDEADDV